MKRWFSALAFALLGITCAAAQSYPSRPITLVVPLGVGGSTDVIGRLMGEGMRQHLGQPIVVENTTGAGGTIGVGRVARAAPDGYTFLIGQWGTNVASGAIYPLQFDLEKDFEPISLIATQPFLIVAKKATPANDLKEFVAYLKANADKVVAGQFRHRHAEPCRRAPVPEGRRRQNHDGALSRRRAVVGRPRGRQHRRAARHAGAVAAAAPRRQRQGLRGRQQQAPRNRARIPTTDEAGLPGFYFTFWHALWAPKGTPKEIIAKLNEAAVKALEDPTIKARLADLSNEIFPREQLTPEALAKFHHAEIEKWWPIIKAADIKAQ